MREVRFCFNDLIVGVHKVRKFLKFSAETLLLHVLTLISDFLFLLYLMLIENLNKWPYICNFIIKICTRQVNTAIEHMFNIKVNN